MKFKDEEAVGQILECAKEEFMQKGFADASMRTIAEKPDLRPECCTAVLQIRTNCFPRS